MARRPDMSPAQRVRGAALLRRCIKELYYDNQGVAALAFGVSRQLVNTMLKNRQGVSPVLAIRIECLAKKAGFIVSAEQLNPKAAALKSLMRSAA